MSDVTATGSDALSSARLAQFQAEVEKLRVTGGTANPERTGAKGGVALMAIGVALAVIGLLLGLTSDNGNDNTDAITLSVTGTGLGIVGSALWLRNSLTRYFRFWLIRLVYEQREQTDRIVGGN